MPDWPELTQVFRVIAVPCHREHFLAGGHPDDDTRGVEKGGRSREKRLKIAFRLQATDRGAERRCLPEIDRGWRIWPRVWSRNNVQRHGLRLRRLGRHVRWGLCRGAAR